MAMMAKVGRGQGAGGRGQGAGGRGLGKGQGRKLGRRKTRSRALGRNYAETG